MFRPNETIQKLLISTTSRFVGEYETKDILITHSWPIKSKIKLQTGFNENHYCRNFYVVVFETPPLDKGKGFLPEYNFVGDLICIYLSILFGKRFDNHGLIESIGMFNLPNLHTEPIAWPTIEINNHSPRKDFGIELNLANIKFIEGLIYGSFNNKINTKLINIINTTGKFYLKALQMYETEPEISYLNLITCGEILSNYYDYPEGILYDDFTKNILLKVEQQVNKSAAKYIRSRLFQIKKKYVLTLTRLLNDLFYLNTVEDGLHFSLKKDDIEKRIKASYDLRSIYVHSGYPFGEWIMPHPNFLNEIQLGIPVVDNKHLQKMLTYSPTFIGLERIIRYCLLRFIHLEATYIDFTLND